MHTHEIVIKPTIMVDGTQGCGSNSEAYGLAKRVRKQGNLLHIWHEAALRFDIGMGAVISAHDALLG
jgi:hypothetical protein